MLPKSILAFDIDGTLTPRNQFLIHPKGLSELLNKLNALGHYIIPVTGKPVSYATELLKVNKLDDRGIIAENAGVYRNPGEEEIKVFGSGIEEIKSLKQKLVIEKTGVTNIVINNKKLEVVVDPGDVSILTIFTDPSYVSHRWTFKQSISAAELVDELNIIIKNNNWQNNLLVLPPFPDGAIQVIRKDPQTNLAIDKESLILVFKTMYSEIDNIPMAMFGDGHNDIPAMKPAEIIPITFANAHEDVKKLVKTKNGYLSKLNAPEEHGIADGLLWLAKNNFFKDDSQEISQLIKKSFPGLT